MAISIKFHVVCPLDAVLLNYTLSLCKIFWCLYWYCYWCIAPSERVRDSHVTPRVLCLNPEFPLNLVPELAYSQELRRFFYLGFEVLTSVAMNSFVFWDITQSFACCLTSQPWRWSVDFERTTRRWIPKMLCSILWTIFYMNIKFNFIKFIKRAHREKCCLSYSASLAFLRKENGLEITMLSVQSLSGLEITTMSVHSLSGLEPVHCFSRNFLWTLCH